MHSAARHDDPLAPPADGRNPLYYLDNFQRVLAWIADRYACLLDAREADFIHRFGALPCPARALLVRMIMRKGTLFRASKLHYEEIGCPMTAASQLPVDWLATDPDLDIDSVFALCSRQEVALAFALPAGIQSRRKGDQLAALRETCGGPRPFSAWLGQHAEPLYQVLVQDLCDRLRLIFFGNFRQDWTELILSDLGLVRYEAVAISPASQGFRNRADVDQYIALHQAKQAFQTGAAVSEVLAQLPSAAFDNDWLEGRRQRLLFQLGQQLEKQQDWDQAQAAYAACRYPGARARAVRVLEKTRQFGAAHRLLSSAMRAPESEAERQHLLRIAPRLTRQLGLPTTRAPKAPPVDRLDLQLPRPGPVWWVEGVVRDHLARADAPVLYVENALINALFGLLCWRAIFAPVPGAFFHPYQRGPVDLHSADFTPRRAALFAACLEELDSGDWRATIRANFENKQGIASPFVGWDFLDAPLLTLALECIDPRHLRHLFERMLVDLQANRSGFPDLIQFWPAERRYRMIEVKGPGDRLQDNQLRWLDYCARHAIPVTVCYLQWTNDGA